MVLADEELVRSAAAYMDEIKPGWHLAINPLTLSLQSACNCVCGQNGLLWAAVATAFESGDENLIGAFSADWLEPLWLEEIAQRMPSADREPVPASTRRPLVASQEVLS